MLIRDLMRKQGEGLFRRRNVLPFLLLPLALLALRDSGGLEARFGESFDDAFEWLCLGVSLVGVALRVAVAGCVAHRSSGRNARKGHVADELNTTGLYSLMRHPLYLANFVIFAGFLLVTGNLWIVLAGSLVFYMYYERIALAEEEFLLERFGARYLAWVNVTPLLPRLRGWRAPELRFCWRSAIRREYRTLCSTLLAFVVLDEVEDTVTHGRIGLEPHLILLLAFAGLTFLLVRLARQHTRWLHAPER